MTEPQAAARMADIIAREGVWEDPLAPENRGRFLTAEGPAQVLRSMGQAPFGLGDEAAGVVGGIGGLISGEGWQAGYDRTVEHERDRLEQYGEANPTARALTELLPSLPLMLTPAGWAARGGTTLANVGRGILAGGATGAAYGAGTAEGGFWPRLEGAVAGVWPAALVGGALPLVAPAIARNVVPQPQRITAPTVDELRAQATAGANRMTASGLVTTPQAYDDFVLDTWDQIRKMGLDPDLHPATNAVLNRLFNESNRAQHSIEDLHILRQLAGDAAGSQLPRDAARGAIIRDRLDDWLDGLTPADIAAGNPDEAVAGLRTLNETWARMRKTETLEALQERAQNAVGANYTSAGLQTALRQQFRALANNPRQFNRFTDAEQEAILEVVRGGGWENAFRRLGSFAPRGFFTTMLPLMAGSPHIWGLTAAGEIARRASTGLANRSVDRLSEMVRRGVSTPAQPVAGLPSILGALQAGNQAATPRYVSPLLPPMPIRWPQLPAVQ